MYSSSFTIAAKRYFNCSGESFKLLNLSASCFGNLDSIASESLFLFKVDREFNFSDQYISFDIVDKLVIMTYILYHNKKNMSKS